MKRLFKSAVALVLAYTMTIGGAADGALAATVYAAEDTDVFSEDWANADEILAEEDSKSDAFYGVPEAAQNDSEAKEAPVDEAVFSGAAAEEVVVEDKYLDDASGDAKKLTVELAEGVEVNAPYNRGEKETIAIEINLSGAEFKDGVNTVSVTQKNSTTIIKEVPARAGGGTVTLTKDDITFNEEGYVLADSPVTYVITPVDETIINKQEKGEFFIPDLKGGKTITDTRLRKAVKIDTNTDKSIIEDKDKWTFELVSASQVPGKYENSVFTAATTASRTQVTMRATYPAVDVDGDGTAEYNATSTDITFYVSETLSQNLRFRNETKFVDGVFEVENTIGTLYDLSVVSDDRLAKKHYESSDEGVVKIDSTTGLMSPGKNGEAVVTATSVGSSSYGTEQVQVTVRVSNMVSWLWPEYNNVTLFAGESIDVPLRVEPAKTTTETLFVTAASTTQSVAISESMSIHVEAGAKAGFSIVTIKSDDQRGTETHILVQTVTSKDDIIDISKADPEAIKDLANYPADEIKGVLFTKGSNGLYEPNLWIGGYEESYTYTGKTIKPEPDVYEGLTRLVKKRHYTLSYGKNTNAGKDAGTIKVKFKGNYKGAAKTAYFDIEKASLADPTVIAAGDVVAKNLTSAVPPVYLLGSASVVKKYNSSSGLKKEPGITATASQTQKDGFLGTIKITARDNSNYTGEIEVKVYSSKIVKSIYTVSKRKYSVKAVDYTDSPIQVFGRYAEGYGQIKSSNGGKYDVDYEVIGVANNIKPGTATVFIRGIGSKYRGSKKFTFKIRKKSKTLKDGARFIQSNKQVVSANQVSRLQIVPGINSGLVPVSGINAYIPASYEDNAVYYAKTGGKIDYYVYDVDTNRRLMEGYDYKLSWRTGNIKKVDTEGLEVIEGGPAKLRIKGTGGYSDLFNENFEPGYKIMPVPLDEESGLVVVAATGTAKNQIEIYSRIDGSKFGAGAFSFSNGVITGVSAKGLEGSRKVSTNSALDPFKLMPVTYTGTYITKDQLEEKSGDVSLSSFDVVFANNIQVSKSAVAVCTQGSAARAVKFTISKRSVVDKTFTAIASDGTKTSN